MEKRQTSIHPLPIPLRSSEIAQDWRETLGASIPLAFPYLPS